MMRLGIMLASASAASPLRRPDRQMRNFNIDAGGVRARRLIDRALARQAAAAGETAEAPRSDPDA